MAGYGKPWAIAGGWALDLHLGRVTRPHKDVDIMVFRQDQLSLQRHLAGWHLYIAHDGALYPWREGEYLQLPFNTIWAYQPSSTPPHTPDMPDDLEFLLDDVQGDEWRFRRNPAVRRPLAEIVMLTAEGIPFLSPEIVLLYKAKHCRAEDEADFDSVLNWFGPEQKGWLAAALRVTIPGHAWLARLQKSPGIA